MKIISKINMFLFQLRLSIAKKGPYRFFLKSLDKIGDPNLAYNVIRTEFFRDMLQPVELSLESYKKIVILAPHQDDEAIGAGGLLKLFSQQGADVHIIFVSNGAQPNFADIVNIRAKEAEQAAAMVGATVHNLGIDDISCEVSFDDLSRLSSMIAEITPDLILAPWLLDAPGKHRLTNLLFYWSQQGLNGKVKAQEPSYSGEVWGYQVHNPILANGYADITNVIDEKLAMIRVYDSQLTEYKAYDHIQKGLAAWNAHLIPQKRGEISEKYYELFLTLPAREYYELIQKYYLQNIDETFKQQKLVLKSVGRLLKLGGQ